MASVGRREAYNVALRWKQLLNTAFVVAKRLPEMLIQPAGHWRPIDHVRVRPDLHRAYRAPFRTG